MKTKYTAQPFRRNRLSAEAAAKAGLAKVASSICARNALLCAAAAFSMITGTQLAFFRPEAPAKASHPAGAGLTFAERVAYQRAIERVTGVIGSVKGNSKPKPSLDEVMSAKQIEKKVEDISASHRRWRITGNGRLRPSSCRLKWIACRSAPGIPRC